MRITSKRTTAAVLRSIVGVKVEEMAELLGCSTHALNSLETGRLKLSEMLATKMVHETGIALGWLLAGDVSAPPVNPQGEPFTAETFERQQAHKVALDRLSEWEIAAEFLCLAGRMRSAIQDAQRRKDVAMTLYKLGKFLGTLPGGRADTEAESVRWMRVLRPIESDIAEVRRGVAAVGASLGFPKPTKATKKGAVMSRALGR